MILTSPSLPYTPRRIISLVPSQTELLYRLGLETETVGITKFCIHPDTWYRQKTRVGGTKSLKPEIIRQLNPDLIIANKEENVQEQVETLARDYPVWVTDVNNLEDALQMIHDIGALTGKTGEASVLISAIQKEFDQLQTTNLKPQTSNPPPRTAYLIWQDPCMTAGGDTFIHDMLTRCGFENCFAGKKRYPETTIAELQALDPGLLLLSSEPFPFKQKHADEFGRLLPGCRVMLVNGEYFSWYGSRLLDAPAYFKTLRESCY
ncbi:MAG TPA: helical backbone metal receptor [Ferruginibacter sp.]|nr:helical backbone metal receptor [Ferruginibacter sp.]HNA16381.1 helical backbone metal receptor [Ferruginibacter sp.]HNJ94935.1 helical backbone metal receptor [Ferruginibacter sp.]HNL63953.1 helical backbone metal receptor [Ferruginibacter sp.]